jgi:uracil phosphoribosyltransferase
MGDVHLIDHPLVQHKLTLMRRKDASTNTFRQLLHEISALMAYEVLRDMPMHEIDVETPLETTTGNVIDGKKLVFVSILRAGTGILDGMLAVVPGARVGHIGLYRDPKTLVAVDRSLSRRCGRAAEGIRSEIHQVRLPADVSRGDRRHA